MGEQALPLISYLLSTLFIYMNTPITSQYYDKLNPSSNKGITTKPKAVNDLPRHKIGERFLKGPIPVIWLRKAMQLSGKSLHVALVIWYLAGMKNKRQIKLTQKELDNFDINRHAKYRALEALEGANLIQLVSEKGKNPLVTLLDV